MRFNQLKRPSDNALDALDQNWRWSYQLVEQLNMMLEQLEKNSVVDLQMVQGAAGGGDTALLGKQVTELSNLAGELQQRMTSLDSSINSLQTELKTQQARVYIAAQGTSGIWTWRKWSDGVAECWGRLTATVDITGSGGIDGVVCHTSSIYADFPADLFTAAPVCQVNYQSGYASFAYVKEAASATRTSKHGIYRIGAAETAVPIQFDYYAIGNWK